MSGSPTIRWVRILIGGFAAEVLVFAVVIPVVLLAGQRPLLYLVPPACFVSCLLLTIWVCRPLESGFVLHGALVGVVATVLYVAMTRAGPEPFAYLLAHGLKILGGTAGGFVAGRRPAKPRTA